MPTKIIEVEGIGSVYAETLQAAGVSTLDQLLERAGTATQRAALAKQTGISEKADWIARSKQLPRAVHH